jgi:hypothetical protein
MEPVAHFGLGRVDSIERVAVRWPGGAEVVVEAPAAGQVLRVAHP